MRFVIQRVTQSSVTVDGQVIGKIGKGFMVLIGVEDNDTKAIADKMISKLIGLRVFQDDNDKMNLSLKDVNGELLLISQFTLYADCKKGNRPSFVNSMAPDAANSLYNEFNEILRNEYEMVVETGIFGAHMILDPICDGPVTIELEF